MADLYLLSHIRRDRLKYGISRDYRIRMKQHVGFDRVVTVFSRRDADFIELCMHALTSHMRVMSREYLEYRPRVVCRLMRSLCILSDEQDIWPLIRLPSQSKSVLHKRFDEWDRRQPRGVWSGEDTAKARHVVLMSMRDAGHNLRKIFAPDVLGEMSLWGEALAHPDMDGWQVHDAYRKLKARGTQVRAKS